MKTYGVVGIGLAVALSVAALAMQQPNADDPQVKTLADADAAIHALTLKVSALEKRLDTLEGRGVAAAAADESVAAALPATSQAMLIESIETVKADQTVETRIRELENQADALEKEASSLDTAAQSITIDTRSEVDYGPRQAARRQQAALKQQAGDARREARQKREEVKDLKEAKQIVRGWSGKRSIELITERDLSATLSKIGPGKFITAKYTLIDINDDLAVVRASSITEVARPAGFVDRPKGN